MFCLITNINKKKTKGPTGMELFIVTEDWFLTPLAVRCVHRVTRHSDKIFKFFPHTRRSSWLLQWSLLLGQLGYVAMLGRILYTKCTLHSNHTLTVWYSNTQNAFSRRAAILSVHTLASPSGRNGNKMKNNLLGKKFLGSSFYLYRFGQYVYCGFPTVNFCISLSTLWNALCVSNSPPDSNTHGSYIYRSYRTAIQQILKGTGQKTVR